MIQIGFCDDDPSVLDELHELLGSYRAEHNADIAPTAFQSPFELLASIEKGARFDILLLDVLMPGENGIEAAREIRQYDSNVKIIFLTSSQSLPCSRIRWARYSISLSRSDRRASSG